MLRKKKLCDKKQMIFHSSGFLYIDIKIDMDTLLFSNIFSNTVHFLYLISTNSNLTC
jgi:hypothetical protein